MDNTIAVVGKFGTGKSLKMVELGANLADKYRLKIVTNFPINRSGLQAYGRKKKLKWLPCVPVIEINLVVQGLDALFKYPNSVVLFDEAGGFLNSRAWKDTSKGFLLALFQLRHDNIYLIAGYQFLSQVDKQFREVCQNFVVCSSTTERRSKKSIALRLPILLARFAHYYDAESLGKIEFEKPNPLRRWMMAIKVEWSLFALKAFLFSLVSGLRYVIVEILNVIRWYRAKIKVQKYLPIPHTKILTDEELLFACFSSSARLDKTTPTRLHKWVEWNDKPVEKPDIYSIPWTHS